MAFLSLLMLGPFQVALDGHPVTGFESCKARALLAYLTVEAHRPHPRSHLADLLWPDLSEPAALGNLRHALANLRRVLGDHEAVSPFVQADHERLQFDPASHHRTDLAAFTRLVEENSYDPPNFEQLERAIDLYRGEFLEQMELDGCPEFEEWVLLRREGCGWLLMTALRLLCDCYVNACRFDEAVRCARQMVHRDPWDEVAHQHLMRTLALAGHRGDALRQYATCQRLLRAELKIDPSSSTTALYENIRDGAFGDGAFPSPKLDGPPWQVGNGRVWRQARTPSLTGRHLAVASARAVEFALDL